MGFVCERALAGEILFDQILILPLICLNCWLAGRQNSLKMESRAEKNITGEMLLSVTGSHISSI